MPVPRGGHGHRDWPGAPKGPFLVSTRDLGRFLSSPTVLEQAAPRGVPPKPGLEAGPSPGIQGSMSLSKLLGSTTVPWDEIVAAALYGGEPNAESVLGGKMGQQQN